MPDRQGPRCPNCQSDSTERLPFLSSDNPNPTYSCNNCGHVWRQPKPKASDLPKREHVA